MRPAIAAVVLAVLGATTVPTDARARRLGFTDTFGIERCTFATQGRNPFFLLVPGHQLVLEGEEKGVPVRVAITVLDATLTVDGVETRVVEERESEDGEIVEISRNYFAFCPETGSVFYFGEDVDNYEDGVVDNHDGSWRAGVDGARAGVIMPGLNLVGARYHQEIAPDVALDRAETLSVTETLSTPAGDFTGVLKVKETTPLERGKSFKYYAPDVGLVQDEDLVLTGYTAP
jgi:hypothetical protein